MAVSCDDGLFDYHVVGNDRLLIALDKGGVDAAERRYLVAALTRATELDFRQSLPPDEVAPIDGDPFTDSQEYPRRFRIVRVDMADHVARLQVQFRDDTQWGASEVGLRRRQSALAGS